MLKSTKCEALMGYCVGFIYLLKQWGCLVWRHSEVFSALSHWVRIKLCGILLSFGGWKALVLGELGEVGFAENMPWWWDMQPKEGGKVDNKPALSWHWVLSEEAERIACMVSVTRRKTPLLLGFMDTASFTDGMSAGNDCFSQSWDRLNDIR